MKASLARKIIEQAIDDETYEGSIPKDDAKALEVAQGLVEMAQDAWDQNIKGDEVANILKLAAEDEDGDEDEKPAAKPKPKPAAKAAPKAKPGRPTKKEPEPEPEPEDSRASEEPWEGYDTDKVGDIIEGLEVWAESEEYDSVQHILLYESANKNRVRIVNKAVEVLPDDMVPSAAVTDAEPEPDEEPEAEVEPEEETPAIDPHQEPFEGYADLKIKDIKESLEEYLENDDVDDEDKLATLEQTFAFESVNKGRASLMDYIDEKKKLYSQEEAGGEDDEAGEASEEGDAEDAAAHEADAGAEDGDQGGEDDREDAPAPAAKRSGGSRARAASAASDSFVISTKLGKSAVEITCEGRFTAAGTILDLLESGATSVSVDVR